MGHVVSENGISVDPERAKAIVNMNAPHDRKSLERFLGMITYVSRFVPNASNLTAPLRSLLKKDIEFLWSFEHDRAFEK